MAGTFQVECSGLVEIGLEAFGLTLETDRIALDALASRIGVSLPDQPRVLVMADNQPPRTEDMIIIGGRQHQVPAVRDENDILVYSTTITPTTEGLTTSLAGALTLRRAEERQARLKGIGWAGVVSGLASSGLGYGVAHNRPLELAGYGLVVIGGFLIYESSRPARADIPNLEGLEAPIKVVPR